MYYVFISYICLSLDDKSATSYSLTLIWSSLYCCSVRCITTPNWNMFTNNINTSFSWIPNPNLLLLVHDSNMFCRKISSLQEVEKATVQEVERVDVKTRELENTMGQLEQESVAIRERERNQILQLCQQRNRKPLRDLLQRVDKLNEITKKLTADTTILHIS